MPLARTRGRARLPTGQRDGGQQFENRAGREPDTGRLASLRPEIPHAGLFVVDAKLDPGIADLHQRFLDGFLGALLHHPGDGVAEAALGRVVDPVEQPPDRDHFRGAECRRPSGCRHRLFERRTVFQGLLEHVRRVHRCAGHRTANVSCGRAQPSSACAGVSTAAERSPRGSHLNHHAGRLTQCVG